MIHNYQRLLGSNLMITFLLCIIFSPLLLHGQMTALINYQYYSPSSNYSSITEENRTNGIVSTRGSHAPIYNRQAFLLMDVQNAYDACQQPINTLKYPNGIAIIHRGGDCTFSVKITRAKQYGAAAVIIYDPRSNNQDVFDMLQNDSNILALYVPRSIGSVLFNLTNDSQTYLNISLLPTNLDYEDPNRKGLWYSSRGAIIFVAISICILVCLFISWFIFYYCQRYRSRTAKDHLQNRLTNAAKKALTKIPLITITATPPIEESCVICLDAIKAGDIVRQLKCTHTFHQTCVDPWLINHRHCPLCNLDILAAYSISIPGTTTRRHAVEPEQSMPMSYTSLATTAAPRVFEQNNSPRNEQSRQTSVNIQHPPIPTISGSLRDDIHGEQNSLFRMDNDH